MEKNFKKFKKSHRKIKNLHKVAYTVDSIIFIGPKSTSRTLTITGFALVLVPITAGVGSGVALTNKLADEVLKKEQKKNLGGRQTFK